MASRRGSPGSWLGSVSQMRPHSVSVWPAAAAALGCRRGRRARRRRGSRRCRGSSAARGRTRSARGEDQGRDHDQAGNRAIHAANRRPVRLDAPERRRHSSLIDRTEPKWPGVPGATSATTCSPPEPRWRSSDVQSGSPVSWWRRRAASRRSCRVARGGPADERPDTRSRKRDQSDIDESSARMSGLSPVSPPFNAGRPAARGRAVNRRPPARRWTTRGWFEPGHRAGRCRRRSRERNPGVRSTA